MIEGERILIGYSSFDLEKELMQKFFESWKEFNQRLDRTITDIPISLHDRTVLYSAYVTGWRGTPSSDNLIV